MAMPQTVSTKAADRTKPSKFDNERQPSTEDSKPHINPTIPPISTLGDSGWLEGSSFAPVHNRNNTQYAMRNRGTPVTKRAPAKAL
jgi:hypothetical protein